MAGKGDKEKPKPKTPEKPSQVADSKKKLLNFSDVVSGKIFSEGLADFADRTGLSLVGDLKTNLEKKVNVARVKYYIKEAREFESALAVFIPEGKEREEYIAVLADLLGNIGGDKFKDFIGRFDEYLGKESGLKKYAQESDPEGLMQKFDLSSNIFDIEMLRELLEVSKSMPDHIIFLGKKYLGKPLVNRAYTEKEKDERVFWRGARSFTLEEMVRILKEHGEEGETILHFIDLQMYHPDFKNRKQFILRHLEQFKKICSYFVGFGNERVEATDFNLDLLEDGDHMETLQKLLEIIDLPWEPSFDRAYIRDYAEKLFVLDGILSEGSLRGGGLPSLPTKNEMRKNGDLLIEIAKTTKTLPYKAHDYDEGLSISVTKMDKKIFENFGWASGIVFKKYYADERTFLLRDIQLPKNKKLSQDLMGISLAVEGQGEDIRDFMSETLCEVLLVSEEIKREDVELFIENYRKYPRIAVAMLAKVARSSGIFPLMNVIIGDLEGVMESTADYEKTSELFEWIPSFGSSSQPFLGSLSNERVMDIIRNMTNSPWAMDVIYRNRGFLNSYVGMANDIIYLIQYFPLQLLDQCKDQLLELARKYDDGIGGYGRLILQNLLFYKIHSEVDLQFYIENSDKILLWYKKVGSKVRFHDREMVELSPSRPFLEAHLDEVINLTDQFDLYNYDDVLQFFAYLNDKFIQNNFEIVSQLLGKMVKPSSRDLSNLKMGLRMCIKHRDKLQFIVSKLMKHNDFSYVTGLLSFLGNRPELFEKYWNDSKSILEKFSNDTLSPDVVYTLMERWLRGANPDVIEKIVKLFVIDGYTGYSDRKEGMLKTAFRFVDFEQRGEDVAEIIDNFFEEHGDLPDKSDKKEYEKYLIVLDNLKNSLLFMFDSGFHMGSKEEKATVGFLKEYGGYVCAADLEIVGFLQKTGCDQEIIEEFIEGTEDAYDNPAETSRRRVQYLLTDYSDNSDLRKFDYEKIHLYEALFAFTRRGWGSIENTLLQFLDLKDFKKEMSGKNIFEIESIVTTCSNRIDPRLGYLIFKEVILPKLKDGSMIGKTLLRWSGKNASGEIVKIDVTQNNLSTVNAILRMLGMILKLVYSGRLDGVVGRDIISANIKVIFPNFQSTGDPTADIRWFFEKFDVEEINFKKLDSFAEFIEFQQLVSSMSENKIGSAVRYLENSMKDIDFSNMSFEGAGYSIFDVSKIELLRQLVNAKNRIVGDMLVDIIGSKFLETNCCEYKTIGKLIDFAHAWENPGFDRDVDGLYQVYSTYAFVEIASFIKENIEQNKSDGNRERVERKLKEAGVDSEKIIKELETKGYLMLTPSNSQKAVSALKDGFYAYTFRKGVSKLLGEESVEFAGKRVEVKESGWVQRDGVKVYSLVDGVKEIAKVIKCDPSKIKVKVLAEPDGIVNMDAEARTLGRKLIFSAPLTFTTGARKMTELAFRDGIQMNYLLSPYSKDGFLLVNRDGEQKVLNKKRLKISDFITVDDLQNEKIREALVKWANGRKIDILNVEGKVDDTKFAGLLDMNIHPVQRFLDKNTFFALIRAKKYSLLGGMLLIDKEEGRDEGIIVKLEDGGDSRRFYLEFEDGQFGIIDSTENISSGKLVELALFVGATKAIYMDTGMYDMAAYQDGRGETHIMGHMDTSESTNRVVIYEK